MSYVGLTEINVHGLEGTPATQKLAVRFILRQDGDRFELRGSSDGYSRSDLDKPDLHTTIRIVRTGGLAFEYEMPTEHNCIRIRPRAEVWENFSSRRAELQDTIEYQGMLEGYTYGSNGLNIAQLLEQSRDLSLQPSSDNIGNKAYPVLTGSSKFGQVSVTLDPDNGYQARRITLMKHEGDLLDKRVLPIPNDAVDPALSLKGIAWVLDDVQFRTVDNRSIPTAGKLSITHFMSDGSRRVFLAKFHRQNIDLHPDFGKLGAFKVDLPENTTLFFADGPRASSGMGYEWRGGKVVADDDAKH